MQSRAVFFTEGIYVAGVFLVCGQGVDQDGSAKGHGHHHQEREYDKERHGHFDEAGEDGVASVAGEVGVAGVAEEASECKLKLKQSFYRGKYSANYKS